MSEQDTWNTAEPEPEYGEWFAENLPLDPIEAACVDGGIAGAIQYLERTHGIDIQE